MASVIERNMAYAKPAPPGGYLTQLPPQEEAAFQQWVAKNKVPFDPSPQADYDMRGFYEAMKTGDPRATTGVNQNDGKLHFGDYWKTPYHKSFSAESQWATNAAPRWNEKDQLVLPDGSVVFDERAANSPAPQAVNKVPTIMDHARAYARAKAAGDTEAADYIHQQLVAAQSAQDKQDYNPTSGMSSTVHLGPIDTHIPMSEWATKGWANLGAGLENAGLGAAQLVLPKFAERAVGITDESINERRARDETLAESIHGGKATQVLGEALPYLAMPGGSAARGAMAVPGLRAGLGALGVGTRMLPTIMADSAIMGGLSGAATPTTSDESAVGRGIAGAAMGAGIPAALYGFGKLGAAVARPFSPTLQQQKLAETLAKNAGQADSIDISPQAQRQLQQAINASNRRVVNAPQSLATLTQDPAAARLELAARANPETAATWGNFDDVAANEKWAALHGALGNDASVQAAKGATDSFAQVAIPEVMRSANPTKLATNVQSFQSAVQGRLNSAVKTADPARQQVYGYVKQALDQGDGSPQMLWNIRKTLSEWLDGTPPPGLEGTRGAKMDKPIMETRKAIDNVLNDATGKRWSKFLESFGEYAQRETAQKAGQNIRNAFFDETLALPRGATTSQGNPAVTRARLEQALARFGKNDFGETLDYPQRNVVDQVLTDLRGEEILQRAKSSMTGKGGSQTAPLQALMQKGAGRLSGGWLSDVAGMISGANSRGQQRMLNSILQNPQDALVVMRQASRINRPLTAPEQRIVQAARNVLASPSALVMVQQPAYASSEQGGQ